ncbi:MAG: hypothetical protein WD077_05070 [Bacteroidia bacterium]
MKLCQVFFLTVCTILLIASSCRKEPVDCCDDNSCPSIYDCIDDSYFTDTVFKPQEFLDYWYFEKGSWWVYQRMDTNATVYDTVRVIATVRTIYCDARKYGPTCFESTLVNMRHSNSFFYKKDSASLTQILDSSPNLNLGEEKVYSSGYVHNGLGYGVIMQWPIRIGQEFIDGNKVLDSNAVTTPYGTLTNTVHIKINRGITKKEVWVTKNIGFTKLKLHSPESHHDLPQGEWALVDYHIVR